MITFSFDIPSPSGRFIAILSQHGTQRLRIMIPDRRPARAEAGVANGHTLAPAARNIAENDPTVQYRLTHMCYDHTTAFYPTDPHMTITHDSHTTTAARRHAATAATRCFGTIDSLTADPEHAGAVHTTAVQCCKIAVNDELQVGAHPRPAVVRLATSSKLSVGT